MVPSLAPEGRAVLALAPASWGHGEHYKSRCTPGAVLVWASAEANSEEGSEYRGLMGRQQGEGGRKWRGGEMVVCQYVWE